MDDKQEPSAGNQSAGDGDMAGAGPEQDVGSGAPSEGAAPSGEDGSSPAAPAPPNGAVGGETPVEGDPSPAEPTRPAGAPGESSDGDDPPPPEPSPPEPPEERILLWRTRVYDSASPFAGSYLNDTSDDPLANEARRALREARKKTTGLTFPGTKVEVGPCYYEEALGKSPSVVFHGMALGLLLEMGFAPSAPCVWEHLRILDHRLRRSESVSPEDPPGGDLRNPWFLRTRHVAWALAMLAELPSLQIPRDATAEQRRRFIKHRELAELAYAYLDGGPDAPATWVGLRQNDNWWSEYWRPTTETDASGQRRARFEREPNLLNTVYASLSIARGARHGLGAPTSPWSRRRPLPAQVLGELADRIEVHITDVGPRTRLGSHDRRRRPEDEDSPAGNDSSYSPWKEEWAKGGKDLPPGVVGLLCIFLIEYAYTVSQTEDEDAGRPYLLKAQRLAHDLMSRPDEWVRSIELYSWDPEPGKPAPNWQILAYSVCLRAVLEAGVVGATHEYLLHAFQTIQATQKRVIPEEGTPYTTWVDVARLYQNKPYEGTDWFERVSIHADLGLPESRLRARHAGPADEEPEEAPAPVKPMEEREDMVATPLSIHSSLMAWAALRRTLWREDPRETVVRGATAGTASLAELRRPRSLPGARRARPAPNFDRLVLSGDVLDKGLDLTVVGRGMRPQSWRLTSGVGLYLFAMAGFGATNTYQVLQVADVWLELYRKRKGPDAKPFEINRKVGPEIGEQLNGPIGCDVVLTGGKSLRFAPQIDVVDFDAVKWFVAFSDLDEERTRRRRRR